MDSSWLGWTKENLERGCNPEEVLGILLKNNFIVLDIRQAMGNLFPEHSPLLVMSEYPIPQVSGGINYKTLSELPIMRLGRYAGIEYIDNARIQLFTLEHFLTDKECDTLVKIIHRNLRPSTVTIYAEGFRTSFTSDLSLLKHAIIPRIDKKIAAAVGINPSYSEGIQAQKYAVGQEFKAHTDYFALGTKEYNTHAGSRGNRTWTFMIYLNETAKGGGTRFVNIDKTIYPKKGMAVIWNNLYANGKPNPHTLHWGMPVEKGEKIIITKWFREKGVGSMMK